MYLEAKETARLYKLLSEKLGNDTTEAMFKYIDNKTERSVEATIKSLATKDDIANVRKEIGDAKADTIRWMFVFWIGQVAAMMAVVFFYKKIGSVEVTIKSSATKSDILNVREVICNIRKEIGDAKADTIKWMFVFWIGQVAAMLAIAFLFVKQ